MLLAAGGCFIGALALSVVLTWFVRNHALAAGHVAAPVSHRHIHTTPVPRVGGVSIYLTLISVLGILYFFSRLTLLPFSMQWSHLLPILAPATLVFLLGLYDDLRGVGPYTKFAVQGIAAAWVYFGGLKIISLPALFGNHEVGSALSLILTVFWILWITNAFNLIDGLDGLAAGSALFSNLVVFIAFLLNADWLGVSITAVLSGALLGFLRFNFNPATIFLGDSGSLLVGFLLGTIALHGQKSPTMVAVALPVVSCGLPILETAISVIRRFLSGRPIFGADREHIHHKLLKRGLSQRQVAYVLYAVSALFGLLSLVLLLPGSGPVALVLILLSGFVWVGIQHLGYHEFFELGRVAQRTLEQKQVIINNLAIRRGMEELQSCDTFQQFEQILLAALSENDFDGFELQYSLADMLEAPSSQSQYSLTWIRAGAGVPMAWCMNLDLSDTEGRGVFLVHRSIREKRLMVDINLLAVELSEALRDTIQRLLLQQLEAQVVATGSDLFASRMRPQAESVGIL